MEGMDGKIFARTVDVLVASNPDVTMEMFNKESGVSSSALSQYRTGKTKTAGKRMIIAAANYFKMDMEQFESYLSSIAPAQDNKKDLSSTESTEEVLREILIKLASLPPEKQKIVLDLISSLEQWH